MKKGILLLVLFTALMQAQTITFTDPNFKLALLHASTSNMEASATYTYGQTITNFIKIDSNNDGEIQVSEAQAVKTLDLTQANSTVFLTNADEIAYFSNLEYLNIQDQWLTSFPIDQLTSLKVLYIDSNHLATLPGLSQNVNLRVLYVGGNYLTSLDVTSLVNLEELNVASLYLTSLDVTQNINLTKLVVTENPSYNNMNIPTIDLSHNTSLQYLNVSKIHLTALDLTHNLNLKTVLCSNNQLTALDLSHNTALTTLYCSYNQITDLDFSHNSVLSVFSIDNNLLQTLNLKNGRDDSYSAIQNNMVGLPNPNLHYVCADDFELAYIQNIVGTTPMISSFCSFTPGGNYNTISGLVSFDSNNDGCGTGDPWKDNVKFKISNGSDQGETYSTNNGNYGFFTQAGTNIMIKPELEYPNSFTVTPPLALVTFANANNNISVNNFCIAPLGTHKDVEVTLGWINQTVPGFDSSYLVIYKNKGNQTLSGNVSFTYNDNVLDFVSASTSPTSQSTGTLNWNYSNLVPFETRTIVVTLNANSPQEVPPLNMGDLVTFTTTITPITGDDTPADNTRTFTDTVVSAFDPNDKICLEGTTVSPTKIGDYLSYIINFENTGTAPATNIVVTDLIDTAKLNPTTLQLLTSSSPMTTRIDYNKLQFTFQNINLGPNEHGYVVFKLKTLSSLTTGATVNNNANIYFDYNFPIVTNTASTTFQTLANEEFTADNKLTVYPNPTTGLVHITSVNNMKSLQLFDVQGRVLTTKICSDKQTDLDLTPYTKGTYFVRVTTDATSKSLKISKE